MADQYGVCHTDLFLLERGIDLTPWSALSQSDSHAAPKLLLASAVLKRPYQEEAATAIPVGW